MAKSSGTLDQFHWKPQPEAYRLVLDLVGAFLKTSPHAATVRDRMKHETGTRFIDWVDHIQVPRTAALKAKLAATGFVRKAVPGAPECYVNESGIFPAILLSGGQTTRVGIKAESVVDFLSAWHIADDPTVSEDDIDGAPLAQFRRALAFRDGASELWVIERHGYRGFKTDDPPPARTVATLRHLESFRRRARDWDDDEAGFDHTQHLVEAAAQDLGRDLACDLFFASEREYWQRRNRAAQVQRARQDRLGLGWANHDHHTYRSSRHCFPALIRVFETLGFKCRERFYAGNEAGWGAQVLEQPVCGITIFADVDLSPEEIRGDFAHDGLAPKKELGTVGLWCGLHGEAMLQAGMHHLECVFDYEALRDQLVAAHIETMDPFTSFPFLKQAFTVGERWRVADKRIDRLLEQGCVTPAQASQFRAQGAIGSHLENLERNDGYKGFNQHGVSQIIAKTDPRKQHKEEMIGA
ncbi:MAG: hypothetical protein JNM07_09915 [Phycisphaerae bacterium]|nr:hypothetical protein [Phycisphaerae bacterium]